MPLPKVMSFKKWLMRVILRKENIEMNENENEKFTLNSSTLKNFFKVNLNYRSDMLFAPKGDTKLTENFFS